MVRKSDALGIQERINKDLARMGEGILKLQVEIMLDRFERTDRLIRLAVATLAGMIAVFGFILTQRYPFDILAALGISASIFVVIVSAFKLVRLNTALHREEILDLGPDPGLMRGEVDNQAMDDYEYLDYKASLLPVHVKSNRDGINSVSARQERAILFIIAGVVLHIATIIYILGGQVHV